MVRRQTYNQVPKPRLQRYAGACIIVVCLPGMHPNNGLTLHNGVPRSIFIVYGLTALFVGVLYVAPPFGFCRRVGGEIVISEGLGMIPVLGAHLVQVGDITRAVYLASLPLIVATGLRVWIGELVSRANDEKADRRTMVIDFGRALLAAMAFPHSLYCYLRRCSLLCSQRQLRH